MTDFNTLIHDLEAATKGNWELNARIGRIVGTWHHKKDIHTYRGNDGYGRTYHDEPLSYTISLDAALKLVPEGWNITIEIASFQNAAWLHKDGETVRSDYGTKRAPALALCIAALKARNKALVPENVQKVLEDG